ncbi:hypothetical protein [Streptomyces sp. TE5632]
MRLPPPPCEAADPDEGRLPGQFFGSLGVQVGEGVAALKFPR